MCAYAASKHAGIINTNIVNAPGRTAPGIGAAQLEKLRRYYVEHGCLPGGVAEGIVRSLLADDAYLFVGPEARPGALLARLSRRLTRKVTLRTARRSGYLA